jgi:prevent-host-death family protein
MQTTTFTELRRQAKRYFDAVEQGETVRVTRRGRVIALIIPADKELKPSWKNPIARLKVPGVEISKLIVNERNKSKL